jgi:hypothetical protein
VRRALLVTGVLVAVLAIALPAGFVFGRRSAPAKDDGGYAAGLKAGHAAGLAQGRALQVAEELPAADRTDVQAQFRAGYLAGADDVFNGYDGGWVLGRRYAVVLGPGTGGAAYRITSRVELP